VTDFKKLKVWQKAHAMALDAHRIAGQIRGVKHASLRSQIIRAAMSAPTNIVEGCSQQSTREYSRFLRIALNSTSELEYHTLAARDVQVYGLLRYLASHSEDQSDPATAAAIQARVLS
jgi:four helix bundle protein